MEKDKFDLPFLADLQNSFAHKWKKSSLSNHNRLTETFKVKECLFSVLCCHSCSVTWIQHEADTLHLEAIWCVLSATSCVLCRCLHRTQNAEDFVCGIQAERAHAGTIFGWRLRELRNNDFCVRDFLIALSLPIRPIWWMLTTLRIVPRVFTKEILIFLTEVNEIVTPKVSRIVCYHLTCTVINLILSKTYWVSFLWTRTM